MKANPFTPTFGVTPPLLAAREDELEIFVEGIDGSVGAPGRALLVTGARGSGKTVLLNAVEDAARRRDWLVVSATTAPGIADHLATTRMSSLLHEHDPAARSFDPTGGSASVMGVGGGTQGAYENRVPWPAVDFRSALERLADLAADALGSGVLVTLDEVHRTALPDLRQVTQAVQHAFRDGRQVALVAAGLPSSVSDLLSDDVTSFLRRAERLSLGALPDDASRRALEEPVVTAGRTISPSALDRAVTAAGGYPFLVQLIGHRAWRVDPDNTEITDEHVARGVEGAVRRAGRMILEPAMRDLSEIDRTFLAAMAVDEGPSEIAAIASRMGVDANYANQYRRRLIAAEMVVPAGRGRLRFALPYLRDYLRDHAVTDAFAIDD